MTVTLNEVALQALLNTEDGPVGRFVERKAQPILEAMRRDVGDYYAPASFGIEDDVALDMDGSTAIVGLQDDPQKKSTHAESKSRRYSRLGQWNRTKVAASGS